jgi:hypothetical protein
MDFVIVPPERVRDVTNYQAAAEAVAGTRDKCMVQFWTNRAQVPTSAWIPVENLQVMTAQYERHPNYETPHLRLACWLYPNEEAAKRANAFFMPGVKMPKDSESVTKPKP